MNIFINCHRRNIIWKTLTANITLLLILIFLSSAVYADTAMRLLLSQLSPLQRMQADFSQKTTANGKIIQASNGEMAVSRPGKFYWHLQGLSDQTIIADGKSIWIYDKDLAQVTVQEMENLQADVPGLLLAGSPDYLQRHYTVELIHSPKKGKTLFKLKPREPESLFQYAILTFEDNKPISLRFVDSLDQTTDLVFSNIRLNGDLPHDLFQFTPPKGVDLIKQQAL